MEAIGPVQGEGVPLVCFSLEVLRSLMGTRRRNSRQSLGDMQSTSMLSPVAGPRLFPLSVTTSRVVLPRTFYKDGNGLYLRCPYGSH